MTEHAGRARAVEEWLFKPRFSVLNLLSLLLGMALGVWL